MPTPIDRDKLLSIGTASVGRAGSRPRTTEWSDDSGRHKRVVDGLGNETT